MKISAHCLHELANQVAVHLEERARAYAKRFFSHLISQNGIANGVFGMLSSTLPIGVAGEKSDALDLRRLGLQCPSEVVHLRSVRSKVNLKQHLGVSVICEEFNLT